MFYVKLCHFARGDLGGLCDGGNRQERRLLLPGLYKLLTSRHSDSDTCLNP